MGKKFIFSGINTLPFLLALAAIGILIFILITQFPFQKKDLAQIYPKKESKAAVTEVPSGLHYNLDFIGVPKGKNASLADSKTQRIFVSLEANCRINLTVGDFAVPDENCTDGSAAFKLPSLNSDNSGITNYSVWIRAKGTQTGKFKTVPCANALNPETGVGELWCSASQIIAIEAQGKKDYANSPKFLFYLNLDLNGDGTMEKYSMFDPVLQDFLWNYDDQGLKVLQLRFYKTLL